MSKLAEVIELFAEAQSLATERTVDLLRNAGVRTLARAAKPCKTPGCTRTRRRISRAEHCWECWTIELKPGRRKGAAERRYLGLPPFVGGAR